jgi:hypothetical protein
MIEDIEMLAIVKKKGDEESGEEEGEDQDRGEVTSEDDAVNDAASGEAEISDSFSALAVKDEAEGGLEEEDPRSPQGWRLWRFV